MGLGFHIGQGGIDNLGEYIGQIEMEELQWLQKNGFIIEGETGHLPEAPILSLPYFDDVVLSHEQVLTIQKTFETRRKAIKSIPGFKSMAVYKMEEILKRLIFEKKGLSTCAD